MGSKRREREREYVREKEREREFKKIVKREEFMNLKFEFE